MGFPPALGGTLYLLIRGPHHPAFAPGIPAFVFRHVSLCSNARWQAEQFRIAGRLRERGEACWIRLRFSARRRSRWQSRSMRCRRKGAQPDSALPSQGVPHSGTCPEGADEARRWCDIMLDGIVRPIGDWLAIGAFLRQLAWAVRRTERPFLREPL